MMELSPLAKVLIIVNNYFHDVATAMLLSSALILWLLGRRARVGGEHGRSWFADAYRVLTRVALFSLAWIVIGGIPRTIYFQDVEWNMADPSNRYLFTALMVKHGLMWLAVGLGVWLWARMRAVARAAGSPGSPET